MGARAKTTTRVAITTADLTPFDAFTEDQKAKVRRARINGILNPIWAMQAVLAARIPYFVLCAYLEQESAGGHNVWGSDNTWMRGVELRDVGITTVSEEGYKIYKLHRVMNGNQGVGPMQLTHPSFQDAADAVGGCWDPLSNMLTAADWLGVQQDRGLDWHAIARAYNGSDAYADHHDQLRAKWKQLILSDD